MKPPKTTIAERQMVPREIKSRAARAIFVIGYRAGNAGIEKSNPYGMAWHKFQRIWEKGYEHGKNNSIIKAESTAETPAQV